MKESDFICAIIIRRAFITVFLIIVITFSSKSQTSFVWGKQFGSDKEEYARNHMVDQNGNIFVTGYTYGNIEGGNSGNKDGFITRFDSLGNIRWSGQFGSAGDEDVQWSAIDNNACVYITGTTTGDLQGENHGREDVFIVKYNSERQKLWVKQFGTDSIDMANGIFIDTSGFIYICGATLGLIGPSASGLQDAFVMKLDSNGVPLYTKQFGTALHDGCASVTGDDQGNIFVTGSTFGSLTGSNEGFMDVFIGELTEKGEWVKFYQYGSEGFDIPTSILCDHKKNLYIGGTTSGNFGGEQMGQGDCFFMKVNIQGELVWKTQFGTDKNDGVKAIALNANISDNILISGLTNLPPAHAYIRMYTENGDLLWEKNIVSDKGIDEASGKDVSLDNRGNLVHLGLTTSGLFGAQIGESDIYLIKLRLMDVVPSITRSHSLKQ